MASCRQVRNLLQSFVDDELIKSKALILENHFAECRECSALLQAQKTTSAVLYEAYGEVRLCGDLSGRVMAHLPEMELTHEEVERANWRMKHPKRWSDPFRYAIPAFALLVLPVLGLTIAYSWPPDDPMRDEVVGMVTYMAGLAEHSLDEGLNFSLVLLKESVHREEWYSTGDVGGMLISLAGPTTLKIDANTRLKIRDNRSIDVTEGRVWLDVSKESSGQNFRVRTPAGKVTVYGTTFTVAVDDESTLVMVAEGAVMVDDSKSVGTVLRPGSAAELYMDGTPLKSLSVDTTIEMAWADAIVADDGAQSAFLAIRVNESSGESSERMFRFGLDPANFVQSITFRWEPQSPFSEYSSYNVYVLDIDNQKVLFTGHISGEVFRSSGQDAYTLVVPADKPITNVTGIDVQLRPDDSTGKRKTDFRAVETNEVSAGLL